MPAHVTVYPTKASALNIKHPHGHKMTLVGVVWPHDSFTARRISDGSATTDRAKAYTAPKPAAAEAAAPAPDATAGAD